MTHLVFIIFLSFVGFSFIIWPHKVQKFVIRFNEKFGHIEPRDSFRNSEKYILRLRRFGLFAIIGAVLIFFMGLWSVELGIYIFEKLVN